MMKAFILHKFGIENLVMEDSKEPEPGAGEVIVEMKAASLNFRDLMVIKGSYNPSLALPAIPVSDGAGVVYRVGEGVKKFKQGDKVMSHFISAWIDGQFRGEMVGSTLGLPGPGMLAEKVVLPEYALLHIPENYDFLQASTLPIAALTAWSALVTEGNIKAGNTILTLGTGGVSIFALQFAKAMGARVIITSKSNEKLEKAKELGADYTINYSENSKWHKEVLKLTDGVGADITVENGGARTLEKSMAATKCNGIIAMLGALTGLKSELLIAPVLMKRLRISGILVDSRVNFEAMVKAIESTGIKPVICKTFRFEDTIEALKYIESGSHFGKIAIEI